MSDNTSVAKYLNNIVSTRTETALKIRDVALELKQTNQTAYEHTAKLIYSFQMPADVVLLMFDLVLTQVKHGDNPNAMKMIQSLSRNEKQNFAMVYPHYKECMKKYAKNNNENINNNNDMPENNNYTTINETDKADGIEFNDIVYLSSIDDDHIIINPMRVPKQAWLMKVYANSYNDYCKLVQETIEDFKNNQMTVFLTKPDSFQKKIAGKPFAVAYSVLINDNFSFVKLKLETIKMLDEDGIANPVDKIKISGRVYMDIVLFGAKKFTDKNGNFVEDGRNIMCTIKNDEEMMGIAEEIGNHENIAKYYIEIMTGIPMQNNKQFYKTIMFDSKNTKDIIELVKLHDFCNLDFIVGTNQPDKKILFIHKTHMRKLLKEVILRGIHIQLNPSFDEFKIDENSLYN